MSDPTLSMERMALRKKYGTPDEFATACYLAVPEFISLEEAENAINKYQDQWDNSEEPEHE
jgi:hypothetical protein